MRAKVTLIAILAVIVYAVLGGVAFHFIEQGNEEVIQQQTLQGLSKYASDGGGCLNWTELVRLSEILNDLEDGGDYIDQSGRLVNGSKWDVRRAIFASIAVLTTVGYHALSPDFLWGRVFCIIYGWFGIPLLFTAIKTLGIISKTGVETIGRSVCGRAGNPRINAIIAHVLAFVTGLVLFIFIPAVIFSSIEEWTYAEALYFCVCTVFTIGFGDLLPGKNPDVQPSENFRLWYQLGTGFWVLIVICWYTTYIITLIGAIDDSAEESEEEIDKKLEETKWKIIGHHHHPKPEPEVNWWNGTSVAVNGGYRPTSKQEQPLQQTNQFDRNIYPALNNEPSSTRPRSSTFLVS